ncbi:hypothetical protein [Spirosoma flavum]|uniref:Uncharacterized protein n=1 Tax=Spirosoma flavum TaxID=2048557 RepID=A0ABW6AIC3_9BACT
METIYNWLLHNTGNEGNYYTILNSQRNTRPEGANHLSVMVRTTDFKVMDLFIYTGQMDGASGVNTQQESLTFVTEQQVIDYLSTGKITEALSPTDSDTIRVLIADPAGESGDITFPPDQTT